MILELTIDNLINSGCSNETANKLFNTLGNLNYQGDDGKYYVSQVENKFYTDTDFYRKTYFELGRLRFPYQCPELLPDYYELTLVEFLKKQKEIVGAALFNEENQTQKHILNQIKESENSIDDFKHYINKMKHFKFESKENDIQRREAYIHFLKTEASETQLNVKIKSLFKFIEFLHSNIENFNRYNGLIKELELLKNEKQKLSPEKNYKDKLKFDEVQAKLESKFKILQENTVKLIKDKAAELNVCNFDNLPNYGWNGVELEIHNLKKNFNKDDLPKVLKHKSQYLQYRTTTHKTFLSLSFFFEDLDKITKSLFDYFNYTQNIEFENFETTSIKVSNISEGLKEFKQGHTKFILPNSVLFNTSTSEQPQNKALPPQQTKNPLTLLNAYSDIFIDLELWPDVKCDLKEAIDTIRECYTQNFINNCKGEVTRKLYINNEPDIFFMRELDRVLNITNTSISRINLKFKEYSELVIESFGREISLDRYFQMSIIEFKDFYSFANRRIKETTQLLKQKNLQQFNIVQKEANNNIEQNPYPKPELKESELSEKIKKHFNFLLETGRKNCPKMTIDEFNEFIEILEDYYTNNFSFTKKHTPIKTENVTKNELLKEIKNFYFSFEHPKKSKNIPASLVEMANKVTQNGWSEVKLSNIQKA
jgi:hypothetical protein